MFFDFLMFLIYCLFFAINMNDLSLLCSKPSKGLTYNYRDRPDDLHPPLSHGGYFWIHLHATRANAVRLRRAFMEPASRSTGQLVMSWWDAWLLRLLPILGTCPSISFNRPPRPYSFSFQSFFYFSIFPNLPYPTHPSQCLANSSSVVTSRCTFCLLHYPAIPQWIAPPSRESRYYNKQDQRN